MYCIHECMKITHINKKKSLKDQLIFFAYFYKFVSSIIINENQLIMKKLLLLSPIALIFFIISCNTADKGALSATAQKNLEACLAIAKCFDTKDFSKLGDYIADDAVDHAGETGDIIGLENMKKEFVRMTEGIDNGKSEVIKELADDEYVMSWMRFTGSLKTDMMGMKAGSSYDMAAIELSKLKDGKVIEHWTFMHSHFATVPRADATNWRV